MIGELLHSLFDEVAGQDPATRRAAAAPLMALSALFDIHAAQVLTASAAAVIDAPHAGL